MFIHMVFLLVMGRQLINAGKFAALSSVHGFSQYLVTNQSLPFNHTQKYIGYLLASGQVMIEKILSLLF